MPESVTGTTLGWASADSARRLPLETPAPLRDGGRIPVEHLDRHEPAELDLPPPVDDPYPAFAEAPSTSYRPSSVRPMSGSTTAHDYIVIGEEPSQRSRKPAEIEDVHVGVGANRASGAAGRRTGSSTR